jgi:hypothetical protein
MFCIRYFQFYHNFCFVSASEREGLEGSLAKFGFSVGFVRFANVPESEGMLRDWINLLVKIIKR